MSQASPRVTGIQPASTLVDVYGQLTKARLSVLVLWTTAVGYILAAQWASPADVLRFACTLIGTALAAACANTLNQVLEVERDRAMVRTQGRPLPAGLVTPRRATVVAVGLGMAGVSTLALGANLAAAALALLTIVLYVAIYTPLKVHSSLNTLVGAVCGAIPPMIGWVAATGRLDGGAWALGALLFVWQLPHFLALAWLYRRDYERGGFAMLPQFDETGRLTGSVMVLTSLMLIPLTLSLTMLGLAGWVFTAGATALGAWMSVRALRLLRERTDMAARRVFLASLVYLSLVLLLLVLDRGPVNSGVMVHRTASAQTVTAAAE